jgi:glycosyltransferase involved in cell wall biosynthesis
MILYLAALCGLLGWMAPHIQGRLSRWRPAHLAATPPDALATFPRVSIIVPARDEQETIGPAMGTLLALDYPDLEIIAVDDRSTDRTGQILDHLAAQDARLSVAHVIALPPGWLGKNHALQVATAMATGSYLLFTDADVHFDPTAIRRAATLAVQEELDHLVVFPEVEMHGFWETVSVWFFGIMLMMKYRPWRVPDPKAKDSYLGIGAFNLVRTEAYRRMGGHASLPMEVADDMKLGKLLKESGARADSAASDGMVRVRWAVGLWGIVTGLTKNLYAGFGFRPVPALGSVAALFLFAAWPLFGLFVGPWLARILCLCTVCIMVLTAAAAPAARSKSPLYGLGFPLAALVLIYILLRSMAFTYRQGGIRWRGTFYPLDELRKGVV